MCMCVHVSTCIGRRRSRASGKGTVGRASSGTCKTVRPILLSSKSFPVEQGDDYLTAGGKQGDYISWGGCRFMADGIFFKSTTQQWLSSQHVLKHFVCFVFSADGIYA